MTLRSGTLVNTPLLSKIVNFSSNTSSQSDPGSFIVYIDPSEFSAFKLDYDNVRLKKWLVNLSSPIPKNISELLSLSPNFSLPFYNSKKEIVFQIIKDVENNIKKYNIPQRHTQKIRFFTTLILQKNSLLPQTFLPAII